MTKTVKVKKLGKLSKKRLREIEKLSLRNGSLVPGEPKKLASEVLHLREGNAELEALFKLQHSRTVVADKLWREAHPGSEGTLPDLGKLIDWLVERGNPKG